MLYFLFKNRRVLLIISLVLLIGFMISNYFSNTVDVYVEARSKEITSSIIEESIRNQIVSNYDSDELLFIEEDETGNFSSAIINTRKVNELLSNVTKHVNDEFSSLSDNELINNLSIPFSYAFFRVFLLKKLPNINIKIEPMGYAKTDIISNVREVGINNSLFELKIRITSSFKTLIPLSNQTVTIVNEIPLVYKIINGPVPEYYYNADTNDFVDLP